MYPSQRIVLAGEIAARADKPIAFNYDIGEGHDTTDPAEFNIEGNIYRATRHGSLVDFTMWLAPGAQQAYRGHIQKLYKNGDEDYSLVAPTIQSTNIDIAPGNTSHPSTFEFSEPLDFEEGDYLLVAAGTTSQSADGRQQADPIITEIVDTVDYVTHSKFNGEITTADNVWHMNPSNQAYRQRLGFTAVSEQELVVEKNGETIYSGPARIALTDPGRQVTAGADTLNFNLHPDRVIVSEDEPPAAGSVAEVDRNKLYIQVDGRDHILDISYVRVVDDPDIFTLSSVAFTDGDPFHGFQLENTHGHLSPGHNIVKMAVEQGQFALFELRFGVGDFDPFDYRLYTHLTVYRRRKGATGDWGHHVLTRQTDQHEFNSAVIDSGFLGDAVRYDVILRTGSHGDGAVTTVPATDRFVAYPGGLKRESLPSFDELDNLTRMYDIIRERDPGFIIQHNGVQVDRNIRTLNVAEGIAVVVANGVATISAPTPVDGTFGRTVLFQDAEDAPREDEASGLPVTDPDGPISITLNAAPSRGSKMEIALSRQFGVGSLADPYRYIHAHTEELEVDQWLDGRAVLATDASPATSAGDFHAIRVTRPQDGNIFETPAMNLYVGRISDTELCLKPANNIEWVVNFAPLVITIREVFPQALGAGRRRLNVFSAEEALDNTTFDTELDVPVWSTFGFDPIPKARVERLDVRLRIYDGVASDHVRPLSFHRDAIHGVGYVTGPDWTYGAGQSATQVPAFFIPTSVQPDHLSRGPVEQRFSASKLNTFRESNLDFVLLFLRESGSDIVGFEVICWGADVFLFQQAQWTFEEV